MRKASISETKNNLSRLLEAVKHGESVLVFDRDTPVARIEPVAESRGEDAARINALVRRGLVSPPRQSLDLDEFLRRQKPALAPGANAVRMLIDERMEGR